LKQLGDLSDYARALTYVARFYLEKGDVDRTRDLLAEADTIARKLGGTLLIGTIEDLQRRIDAQEARPSTSSRAGT